MGATQRLLRFGLFELNLDTEELRKGGIPIKLPPQPFRILALLASHAGQIMTREEIRQQIWGEETYVDFEHGMNQCIKQIRTVLGDNTDNPVYVETLPRRGYRFLAPVVSKSVAAPPAAVTESTSGINRIAVPAPAAPASKPAPETPQVSAAGRGDGAAGGAAATSVAPVTAVAPATPATAPAPSGLSAPRPRKRWLHVAVIVAIIVIVTAGISYWHSQKVSALTEKDMVVLADFNNTTGDPVFDGTLRQGLSSQLDQSPFLNLLSDERIARTLSFMAKPRDARLTHELAREVCERTGSAATIDGSIDRLGNQFVLGLKAVNCRDGEVLAEEQVTANGKEQVVKALGEASAKLRKKLGESLSSVQKYDAPPENITTASLEALQAYDLGYKAQVLRSDFAAGISFFQRAVSLDPNFAMAYARMATCYLNSSEPTLALENISKAYELRDKVSEREKFYITGRYQTLVGNLADAVKTYELWSQTYPRDPSPLINLSSDYVFLGDYEKALAANQQALKLSPGSALYYGNLINSYLYLNRLDEARAAVQEAQAHKIDLPIIHQSLYLLDFLQHNSEAMKKDSTAVVGAKLYEDVMLHYEAETAAYQGRFIKARELNQLAVESVMRSGGKERAAGYEAEFALQEALVGNLELAKQGAKVALALARGKENEPIAAVTLAWAGDTVQATELAADLDRRFPDDTIMQSVYLPMIRAAIALRSGHPDKSAATAIDALAGAAPYELGNANTTLGFALYPIYFRGEAYLAGKQGAAAGAEFQKVLDHPGITANEPIGVLARLGLARAYVLSGDTANARAAYEAFFKLWKDADPGIPILLTAKAEYQRLK